MFNSLKQTNWASRWLFILAAVGAAAGIGNLWRFPFLAFDHGGGAFLLAFIVVLIVFVIPLAIGEIVLGQKSGSNLIDAFTLIKKPLKYVGWGISVIAGIILSYYVVVIAWGLRYLSLSFDKPWGNTGESSSDFFFGEVLQLSSSVSEIGSISIPILISVILVWAFIYFSVFKGLYSLQAVIIWTATLPFLTLIVLALHSVTLPGAFDGLVQFFAPDFTALADPSLWIAAFAQGLFSVSVALGIFIVYSTYNKSSQKITSSVLWVVLGDFIVSILAGIVVFSTIGFLSSTTGTPFFEVIKGGPSLVFTVMPVAISLLPAFGTIISILFFGSVVLLGIDSAFALLEVVISPFKKFFQNTSTPKLTFYVLLPIAIVSIFFTTGGGLYYLDIIDHFIIQYAVLTIALIEAILFGWFYRKEIIEFVNSTSPIKIGWLWKSSIAFLAPIVIVVLLGINLYGEIQVPYEGYPLEFLLWLGIGSLVLVIILSYFLQKFFSRNKS